MGAEEATVVGISVCQALAAVHAAGLLHRDVKANNVMRESGGRIVLMDFGAGRETGSDAGGDLAGTPLYMAPEVLHGGPASMQSDLYSVGVLLFYITTGEYPVSGRSMLDVSLAHQRGQRRLLADRRPDLPDGFVRVVERALASAIGNRPPSAGAMMHDLSNALPSAHPWVGPSPNAAPTPTPPATPRPVGLLPESFSDATLGTRSPARLWAGGIAAAALAIGVFGVLTSVAFNQSLRREGYATESLADWWLFGARSLVWPAVLSVLVLIGARLAITTWRGLAQIVPPLKGWSAAVSTGVTVTARRVGATGPIAASQWLVLAQVAALVLVWRRFIPLIEGFTNPGGAGADRLALLTNASSEAVSYQSAMALLVVGMGVAWYRLLSSPGARAAVHWSTLVAGGAAFVIAVVILVTPYRLLFHNEMPRVQVGQERCYRLGARERQVLLYCPDRPPPRITTADERAVSESGIIENIFSAFSAVR
jgi:hypothetical protein